jgi:hypothetical protein
VSLNFFGWPLCFARSMWFFARERLLLFFSTWPVPSFRREPFLGGRTKYLFVDNLFILIKVDICILDANMCSWLLG